MFRATPLIIALLWIPLAESNGEFQTNRAFCMQAIEELADSLAIKLELYQEGKIKLSNIDGRFGPLLINMLSKRLDDRGVTVYMNDSKPVEGISILKIMIVNPEFSYKGYDNRLFSSGRVVRRFAFEVYARLLSSEGMLLRSVEFPDFIKSDILGNKEARLTRGSERFYSPPMPASLYQRLVEPALIIGITGGLVYLFFASR